MFLSYGAFGTVILVRLYEGGLGCNLLLLIKNCTFLFLGYLFNSGAAIFILILKVAVKCVL